MGLKLIHLVVQRMLLKKYVYKKYQLTLRLWYFLTTGASYVNSGVL